MSGRVYSPASPFYLKIGETWGSCLSDKRTPARRDVHFVPGCCRGRPQPFAPGTHLMDVQVAQSKTDQTGFLDCISRGIVFGVDLIGVRLRPWTKPVGFPFVADSGMIAAQFRRDLAHGAFLADKQHFQYRLRHLNPADSGRSHAGAAGFGWRPGTDRNTWQWSRRTGPRPVHVLDFFYRDMDLALRCPGPLEPHRFRTGARRNAPAFHR